MDEHVPLAPASRHGGEKSSLVILYLDKHGVESTRPFSFVA